MGIIMQYTGGDRLDETTVGIVVLGILIAGELVWFLLQHSCHLNSYVRYIFTVHPVLIWTLAGVIVKHTDDDSKDRTNGTAVGGLVLSGLLFLIQLGFIGYTCRLQIGN